MFKGISVSERGDLEVRVKVKVRVKVRLVSFLNRQTDPHPAAPVVHLWF